MAWVLLSKTIIWETIEIRSLQSSDHKDRSTSFNYPARVAYRQCCLARLGGLIHRLGDFWCSYIKVLQRRRMYTLKFCRDFKMTVHLCILDGRKLMIWACRGESSRSTGLTAKAPKSWQSILPKFPGCFCPAFQHHPHTFNQPTTKRCQLRRSNFQTMPPRFHRSQNTNIHPTPTPVPYWLETSAILPIKLSCYTMRPGFDVSMVPRTHSKYR